MKNQIAYFEKYKKKLYDLLILCRNIPYYRDHAEDGYQVPEYNDFTYEYFSRVIPVLEKEAVRNHSSQFLDPSIPPSFNRFYRRHGGKADYLLQKPEGTLLLLKILMENAETFCA